jgi:hypothetical protein
MKLAGLGTSGRGTIYIDNSDGGTTFNWFFLINQLETNPRKALAARGIIVLTC